MLYHLDPLAPGAYPSTLHATAHCTAALELFDALPGEIVSTRPLKNVLDRRPFI